MKKFFKQITLILVSVAALLSSQCLSTGEDEDFYDSSMGDFLNPERGWYRSIETEEATLEDLVDYRRGGVTLVAFETYLGAYLSRDIDNQKLNEIDRAFTYARRAGLSVIYRAAYSFEEVYNCDPKDIRIVLKHISQLKDIFYKNEDILFNVQAGFLGPWGEWHSSNFSEGGKWTSVKPEIQRQVANALLDAVPPGVTVAVRRPEYIRNIAGKAPLLAGEAFSGSKLSRMSFHNDALMSEETDMDTYIDPDYQPREKEFEWINNHTRWTPFVGETNKVSRYNDANNAIQFLDLMNAHSLNIEYHPNVLKKWRNARYNGMSAFEYIGMKLGYRFELNNIDYSERAEAGGIMTVNLKLTNTGFGHLLKEKKFELVLIQDSTIIRAGIDEDARFWNKNEPINRSYSFLLPSDISGDWDIYLGLSSTYTSLAKNPAYSVRFANSDNEWDSELGLNKVGKIRITEADNDSNETEFKQVSPVMPQNKILPKRSVASK